MGKWTGWSTQKATKKGDTGWRVHGGGYCGTRIEGVVDEGEGVIGVAAMMNVGRTRVCMQAADSRGWTRVSTPRPGVAMHACMQTDQAVDIDIFAQIDQSTSISISSSGSSVVSFLVACLKLVAVAPSISSSVPSPPPPQTTSSRYIEGVVLLLQQGRDPSKPPLKPLRRPTKGDRPPLPLSAALHLVILLVPAYP
ncbi:uncharacterized protein K460DRAFT_16343 [Cucurbitaria berberidis CBS 394.84]|uniref:Uncharacterized protein n=1 Tax=Cucurbitaria berberidis CBS 394.84 TaxID=1168544 RepID=A0A9P4GSE3_9PLEO|nr:uncharacterized protein K460DRAFT_16343 [Cucurbitaria berberidis CBS 394.84]KAF1850480.1 hypothetical protein K460DRAFT_16343 [Cucurbitaria berberidis CBS 394.84]